MNKAVSLIIICILSSTYVAKKSNAQTTLNLKLFINGYYIGEEEMRPALLNELVSGATSSQMDTIHVDLHDTGNPADIIESSDAILMIDGTTTVTFSSSISGQSLWIAVRHRNAVQTWTDSPVLFSASTTFDFSTAQSNAYGSNMVEKETGVWAFINGDINQDENIDIIDFPIIYNNIIKGIFGCYAGDLNGDGNVDLIDFPVLDANLDIGAFSHHP